MKETLSKLLNVSADDVLLNYYLELAQQQILNYTNRKQMIDELKTSVIELASFLYQSKNQVGIASRSEGAISESYDTSIIIPKHIQLTLNNYRLLHGVKHS